MTHDGRSPDDRQLFERFRRNGDVAALGELFDRIAPAVLRVALHLARDPEAAEDLVQSTFLRAIEVRDSWDGRRYLLPWLCGILQNRARSARWQADRTPDLARLTPAVSVDPARVAEQTEFYEAVDAAISELPEIYQPVLRMHLAYGHEPGEIAHALGRPSGTVRSQLARGLESLRRLLPTAFAGSAALASTAERGLAAVRETVLASADKVVATTSVALGSMVTGAGVVTMKKMIAPVSVALLSIGVWFAWPGSETSRTPRTEDSGSIHSAPAALPAESSSGTGAESAPGETNATENPNRVVVQRPAAKPTELVVKARFSGDVPAAGVWIILSLPKERFTDGLRIRTDAAGVARFVGLTPRTWAVSADRGYALATADVVSEKSTVVELKLPAGMRIVGTVIEKGGAPLANAVVEMSLPGLIPSRVAQADREGKFQIDDAPTHCSVSARASGFLASDRIRVRGKAGGEVRVKLEMAGGGGVVRGLVTGADGAPVPDAVVRIGAFERRPQFETRGPTIPAYGRTGADGRYLVGGVPLGVQPVAILALDHAPWRGSVEILRDADAELNVVVVAGATVQGILLGADGKSAGGIAVKTPVADPLGLRQSRSAADGSFTLTGLPAGQVMLQAYHFKRGKVEATVKLAAGKTTVCKLQLSRGIVLRGELVDPWGKPIASANILCTQQNGNARSWSRSTQTGPDGRFEVPYCPPNAAFMVSASAPGIRPIQKKDVNPRYGAVRMVATRTLPESAWIVGRVLDPSGAAVVGAVVGAESKTERTYTKQATTDADGRFSIGPVRPGGWRVDVVPAERSSGLCAFETRREVVRNERHDLGHVRLLGGGKMQATVRGVLPAAIRYTLWSADGRRVRGTRRVRNILQTRAIPAGEYQLGVYGAGFASAGSKFTIRAGEVTKLEFDLAEGVRVPVELEVDGPVKDNHIHLALRRAGVRFFETFVGRAAGRFRTTLQLVPGEYEVVLGSPVWFLRTVLTVEEKAPEQPVRWSLQRR